MRTKKHVVHIFLPEDSGKRKPNSTEYHYFSNVLNRNLENVVIKYYTQKKENEFIKEIRKNKNDVYGVLTDFDFDVSSRDLTNQIDFLIALGNKYKHYNNGNIYLSSRSWETWMCMYNGPYTKPYINQKQLEQDVNKNYSKTKDWYSKNSNLLFEDIEKAIDNCRNARKNTIRNLPHSNMRKFEDRPNDCTEHHILKDINAISTITFVDIFIKQILDLENI